MCLNASMQNLSISYIKQKWKEEPVSVPKSREFLLLPGLTEIKQDDFSHFTPNTESESNKPNKE